MKCPICGCMESKKLMKINCGNLDGSALYRYAKIVICKVCEHTYNNLTQSDLAGLMFYYDEEYSIKNLKSGDVGDRPGSSNKLSLKRYEKVFEMIAPYLDERSKILDVGCATGGFLEYLEDKGYDNIYGIERIKRYVKKANKKNILLGDINDIPFEDNSFDVLILDQVIEHLFDLHKAVEEIQRVLTHDGIVCISVPCETKYRDVEIFYNYFYLLREHIQHFNPKSLLLLMKDFQIADFGIYSIDMLSETFKFPNMTYVFRNTDKPKKITYCYGIGREFLYLYENTKLRLKNLVLIDDVICGSYVDGMRIHESSVLKFTNEDDELIITAIAHKSKLKDKAIEKGYKGEIIDV